MFLHIDLKPKYIRRSAKDVSTRGKFGAKWIPRLLFLIRFKRFLIDADPRRFANRPQIDPKLIPNRPQIDRSWDWFWDDLGLIWDDSGTPKYLKIVIKRKVFQCFSLSRAHKDLTPALPNISNKH